MVWSLTSRREKKCTDARYERGGCGVGLCAIGSFEDYHTLKHF